MSSEHLLHSLRSQGLFCAGAGSPMYGELLEQVAADVEAGGVFASILSGHEDDPFGHAVPLRLLGGLHRLVLDGRAAGLRRWYPSSGGAWDAEAAWPEILFVAERHHDSLRAALDHPPQTNEVGRSAALIGGLLCANHEFNLPIRLFEIGTSAGLNLRADHYQYRFADTRWGPADSPVVIADAWRGALPPNGPVRIVERRGYDIAPIDVMGDDGELTVLSYVWPDQHARLQRLRGAVTVARGVPAHLERRTAADAIAGLTLAEGALTVLWHSITWQYLSAEERVAVRGGVEELARRAGPRSPFAHLTLEPARDGPGSPIRFLIRARSWPGGELDVLGECHPHGPPVTWY
ncbi:hypothetical protein BN971_03206 [Mycobacterium bohemicum DSM 44277]|uniref:DUF2332 domain-containing protein n=2 Tax=Mycobacterium bohemicum TaxID=56425 RepID=A0A1X1RC80_MYCBE|nr:DUF2332 family protein [Mycobacterium bohemicum]MCV6968226.1 DUF2332 family protein [Mycobacterium bohemicum]ORV02776.1 hypothetical protein AWB93_02885 [Mycobacterium bohemicum]CPR11913.1 hypothetical protein BN971_03206 [Mycobacterium bohemicum DSM 44277]